MLKKIAPIIALSFVNMLGFMILVPVLPFVIRDFGYPDYVYGTLLSVYPAAQFIGAPILGALSDKYGRKPLLSISQAGTMLSWVIFGASYFLSSNPNTTAWALGIIAFARLFDGITGGNISITNAYLSDVTNKEEKAYAFGINGAAVGIALIIGPTLGSVSSSYSIGYLGTAILAFIISLITLLSIMFYLKESLPESERRELDEESILKKLNIAKRVRKFKANEVIIDMFKVRFIFSFVMGAYGTLITLFVIDKYNFDQKQLGIFFLFVGTYLVFNQLVMVKRFVSKFGNLKTLIVGLGIFSFGLIAVTLVQNLIIFMIFYYLLNLGISLVFPTAKAVLSNNTNVNEQGEVMGVDESIGSLASIASPVLGGIAYTYFGSLSIIALAVLVIFSTINLSSNFKKLGAKAAKI